MAKTGLVVGGGSRPARTVLDHIGSTDLVIAADSGADHLVALGWPCDLLVGDLDSITDQTLTQFRERGIEIDQYPTDKDKTDLEIALDAAMARSVELLYVVAIDGGRIDHELANMALLGLDRFAPMKITAVAGRTIINIVHGYRSIQGRQGELVSMLALNGDACGVTTTGLVYPLLSERVVAGSSRTVSNRLIGFDASVSVERGSLMVIQPEGLAD